MMPILTRPFRRFLNDEDGLIMTEFLIMIPLLTWTFMAMFVYWDTYRVINLSQKASYAVSDLISRHDSIDLPFIDGMEKVMEHLTTQPDVKLRISSVQWDSVKEEYSLLFSRSPHNEMRALTVTDIENMADTRIPVMAGGDSIVIVETEVAYQPGFDVGIPLTNFTNFIVTRPRGESKICLVEQPCASAL